MGHSKAENPRLGEVKAVLQRLQKISDEPEAASHAGLENDTRPMRAATHRGGIVMVAITAALAFALLGTYAFFNFDRLASTSVRRLPSPVTKTTTDVAPGATAAQLPTSPAPSRTAELPAPPPTADPPAQPKIAELPVPPPTGDPPAPPQTAELAAPPRTADPPAQPKIAELPAPPRTADPPTPPQTAELAAPPAPQATLQVALGLMASGHIQAARGELLRLAPEDSADVAWALARSYDPNFLGTLSTADATADIAEATRWYRAWYAIAVKQGLVADSVPLERIIRSMR
jgi:outer membrane biosynthesis protein TonB